MPGFGMHMGQRLEQRLEQRQIQMVMDPGDMRDHPFWTEGEEEQLSQYEILKQLQERIKNGEYIDEHHFALEINRAIFGTPLEARIGVMGRDVSELLKFYQGDEKLAEEIIVNIAGEDPSKKDLPGQTASAWNQLAASPYFTDEKTRQQILSFISTLRQKGADSANGLDVIAKSAKLGQPMVEVSLAKMQEYANNDARIVPFAHAVLPTIFRSIENASADQAKAIYEQIVESLYMLDKEQRVHGAVEKIARSLKDLKVLESRIPVPIYSVLESMDAKEDAKEQFIALCNSTEFKQGREMQRNIYKGLAALAERRDSTKILAHMIKSASGARGLAKILSEVNLMAQNYSFEYPYEAVGEEQILKRLRLQLVDRSIKKLGFKPETLEKYISRIETNEEFARVGKIITTLASYAHQSQNIPLMREILEATMDGKFTEWRYSHNKAQEQLKVIEEAKAEWQKCTTVKRLVGELDGLNSHIDAVKHLLPQIKQAYLEEYKKQDDSESLEKEITENETKMRSDINKKERAELGFKTAQFREKLSYVKLMDDVEKLSTETYEKVLKDADELSKRKSKSPLHQYAGWIRDTLDQPAYRSARKVSICETDDLETILKMGETPVPNCQNWKTDSTLNRTLLSFVADPNKKMYVFQNGNDRPFGISIVRLVNWEDVPTLLIENIYANEWSADYGVALLGSLADKAADLQQKLGGQVRVAAPGHSGHDGHETNTPVGKAMQLFSKKYNVEIQEDELKINPAESKNSHEYYDCGPGIVKSGQSVTLDVSYISFGDE